MTPKVKIGSLQLLLIRISRKLEKRPLAKADIKSQSQIISHFKSYKDFVLDGQ